MLQYKQLKVREIIFLLVIHVDGFIVEVVLLIAAQLTRSIRNYIRYGPRAPLPEVLGNVLVDELLSEQRK